MASVCVDLFSDGTLQPTGNLPANCPDGSYLLIDSATYGSLELASSLWTVPTQAELTGVFVAAFSIPMTVYLVAWAAGVLVNMFNSQ